MRRGGCVIVSRVVYLSTLPSRLRLVCWAYKIHAKKKEAFDVLLANTRNIQRFEVWRLKYDVWSMTSDVIWSMTSEVWRLTKYEVWRLRYDLWIMTSKIWHLKYDVWRNMASEIWRLRYDVWGMTSEIWWREKCEVWCEKCEV